MQPFGLCSFALQLGFHRQREVCDGLWSSIQSAAKLSLLSRTWWHEGVHPSRIRPMRLSTKRSVLEVVDYIAKAPAEQSFRTYDGS